MSSKKMDPLPYYQAQFDGSYVRLYEAIMATAQDDDFDESDSRHLKLVITYLDSLSQLLDELVFAEKMRTKSKKNKKSKKK